MELKLESTLSHQLAPINAVASVVEASMQQGRQESHQNPVVAKRWSATSCQASCAINRLTIG